MSLEIEKKYRLPAGRGDVIIAALHDIGAEYVGEDFEENTIYGGEVLAKTGGVVRIRRTQDRTLLTFKRRVENQADVKQQIEYETEVSNSDATSQIMSQLNLVPKLVYEKKRRTWRLRSTEIVLDELPFGSFMEIEGSITSIKEAEMLLDIEDLETEHETYPSLTARFGKQVGEKIEARFS